MKFFIIASVLFISLAVINCQKEEEEGESEIITSQRDKKDNPIIPSPNDGRGLLDRIGDRISSSFKRIRDQVQDTYQRQIERLQRKAVDSLEKLQNYVDRRLTSTEDPTVKDYLKKLSENIGQLMNSLRNLITSVESRVSETVDKLPKIPEYKFGEQ